MRFLPLIAATYFMVSGGPYGIEDILGGAGYRLGHRHSARPALLWSLPTALMIGELASAIPAEGGFYVWVRRALGPFWGYQESWLSLSASIFEWPSIPPSSFSTSANSAPRSPPAGARYALVAGGRRLFAARGTCAARPASAKTRSGMFALLLAPFAVFVALGFWRGLTLHPAVHWGRPAAAPAPTQASPLQSSSLCGTTWAGTTPPPSRSEVENPQRNYPRAMIAAATLTASLIFFRLPPWRSPGSRPRLFHRCRGPPRRGAIGGPVLAMAVVAGGVICGVGMFNALMMSYTRLPIAMAADGLLAAHFLPAQSPRRSLGQRADLRPRLGAGAQSAL